MTIDGRAQRPAADRARDTRVATRAHVATETEPTAPVAAML